MFCTNCGKEVADGAMFCTSCGAKLAQEPVAQPAAEQPVTAPAQEAPQAAPNTAPVSVPATADKKFNPVIVVVAVAAVLVIALILLLSGGGGGGYKDYKDLVKAYYEAVNKEDVSAMIKLFDKDAQKDLRKDKSDIKEALEDIKDDLVDEYGKSWLKDLEIGKRQSAGKGTYGVSIEIDGDFYEYLYIKKDNKDRYYIDEDFFDWGYKDYKDLVDHDSLRRRRRRRGRRSK